MIRSRRRFLLVLLVALLGAALGLAAGLVACSEGDGARSVASGRPTCPPCACPPAGVVDAVLLAFLSKARAAHHEADLAEQQDQTAMAIAVLQRLVGGAVPGGSSPPPEVREVLADTHARLAELRSARGEFDEATKDIDRGLRLAKGRTHFRGRLFEVRGLVEERRAAALAKSGDEAGATEARARAVDAFEQAIDIQAEVIETALADAGLGEGEGGGPPMPVDGAGGGADAITPAPSR